MKKFFAKIAKFFRELKAEIKKVIWPTKKQLINNTTVVVACILVIGIAIWVLDALFSKGIAMLIG